MGLAFTLDDIAYLRSSAGVTALADLDALDLTPSSLLRDLQQIRRAHGDRASALIETVRLRRKAVGKLAGAESWLLTDDSLQQATPSLVAGRRAERLAGRAVHDVTCSIGAELAALTATCPTVIGSDLDPVRLAMAAGNVPAATLLRADALTPVTRDTVVIADPARRAGGRRTHDPTQLQPPLPDLLDTYAGRDLAVKCAPGLDFDSLDWPGEVELTSLDGGVREACLWSTGLTLDSIRRRATVLSTSGPGYTVTDAQPDDIPEREPGEWIINPDGAVVRAGLVRHYAAKHGLWQLDPRIAYLTGDAVPPGARGFRILTQVDHREKAIRAELSQRDCGTLEILARGVDVDPDALRTRLKLRGSSALSVIVTRIGSKATAFICGPGTVA